MSKYLIKVKPGSSQEKIIETSPASDDSPAELTIYLRAKPHDGEANISLIKLLSKHYNVPRTGIKIIRGHKSRTKVVEF